MPASGEAPRDFACAEIALQHALSFSRFPLTACATPLIAGSWMPAYVRVSSRSGQPFANVRQFVQARAPFASRQTRWPAQFIGVMSVAVSFDFTQPSGVLRKRGASGAT